MYKLICIFTLMARIIESCCGSIEDVIHALRRGADRIELCERLDVGGVTPSRELLEKTLVKVGGDIPVNVLVRPREGDFVYSDREAEDMLRSIRMCRSLGVSGVVIGALLSDGSVDMALMRTLMAEARPMSVTFHRAFDVCRAPFEAFEQIILLGCDRLLTSGHCYTAPEGAELIAELVRRSDGRIKVMAGSGVRKDNLDLLESITHAPEFHGTHIL